MANMHEPLLRFHDKYVKLDAGKKARLRDLRDTNLKRIERGMNRMAGQMKDEVPRPVKVWNQGSYAMNTLILSPVDDYDIDVALVFDAEVLPKRAWEARQQVAAAILEIGGNFSTQPRRRTNAVTVWYADGFHLDFAIYRRRAPGPDSVTLIEHAGARWTPSDPRAMLDWFRNEVRRRSPKPKQGARVRARQLQRIVRLLKCYAHSRPSWDSPGGLLLTVLVVHCYRADNYRDDRALHNTMRAMEGHLKMTIDIPSPIDPAVLLTQKKKYRKQVARFSDRLSVTLQHMRPLRDHRCSNSRAVTAWKQVFNHELR